MNAVCCSSVHTVWSVFELIVNHVIIATVTVDAVIVDVIVTGEERWTRLAGDAEVGVVRVLSGLPFTVGGVAKSARPPSLHARLLRETRPVRSHACDAPLHVL